MAKSLEALAAEFQDECHRKGVRCSHTEAVQLALITAGVLAQLTGDKAATDHFFARVSEVERVDLSTAPGTTPAA